LLSTSKAHKVKS